MSDDVSLLKILKDSSTDSISVMPFSSKSSFINVMESFAFLPATMSLEKMGSIIKPLTEQSRTCTVTFWSELFSIERLISGPKRPSVETDWYMMVMPLSSYSNFPDVSAAASLSDPSNFRTIGSVSKSWSCVSASKTWKENSTLDILVILLSSRTLLSRVMESFVFLPGATSLEKNGIDHNTVDGKITHLYGDVVL